MGPSTWQAFLFIGMCVFVAWCGSVTWGRIAPSLYRSLCEYLRTLWISACCFFGSEAIDAPASLKQFTVPERPHSYRPRLVVFTTEEKLK